MSMAGPDPALALLDHDYDTVSPVRLQADHIYAKLPLQVLEDLPDEPVQLPVPSPPTTVPSPLTVVPSPSTATVTLPDIPHRFPVVLLPVLAKAKKVLPPDPGNIRLAVACESDRHNLLDDTLSSVLQWKVCVTPSPAGEMYFEVSFDNEGVKHLFETGLLAGYKERLKSDPNIQAALKERLRGKTNIFLLEHNIFVCRNCCTTDKEFTLQPSQSGLQSPPASEVSSIRSLSCL